MAAITATNIHTPFLSLRFTGKLPGRRSGRNAGISAGVVPFVGFDFQERAVVQLPASLGVVQPGIGKAAERDRAGLVNRVERRPEVQAEAVPEVDPVLWVNSE